ncbi:beta-glucosidase BglX [Shouchella miscanthi]|uniref:beta-glucosidase BglX n=1 Tax=Shouchella miscanthi TaxID=2598861 RepID=UPI003461C29D
MSSTVSETLQIKYVKYLYIFLPLGETFHPIIHLRGVQMTEEQLQALLHEMTTAEKVGQLTQFAGAFYSEQEDSTPVTGRIEFPVEEDMIKESGSVLGVAGAMKLMGIQREHLKKSRLGIPLLFMADVINGFETIFPIPLGLGATWDPALIEELQTISAKEAASAGLHISFAPMADLVRDPRWGRVMESTGEDPLLNSLFAAATVRGLQGKDSLIANDRVGACVKHFAAYGLAEGGRDYNTVDLSERELRDKHLPAYKAALEAGVKLVMTAFNTVDSIPATANSTLLRDLLRGELQFDGVVISDFGAVQELIPHGVAENEAEAAKKALEAGVDIDMMSLSYAHSLASLIDEHMIDSTFVDEAVLRVLQLKNELGLFEDPYRGVSLEKEQTVVGHPSHLALAQTVAEKSMVLLKNENVLPLDKQTSVALIGPYADNQDLLGEWSIFGKTDQTTTLRQAVQKQYTHAIYAKGSQLYERDEELLKEAIAAMEQTDCLLLALGEGKDRSGEGRSRSSITLAPCQIELARLAKETGKPVIVALFNARPLDLTELEPYADAILECWHPGSEGAKAVVAILSGKVNPSGKLTMSFPRATGQIPVYYNAYQTGRPLPPGSNERFFSRYIDIPNEPLYPFGFGLSYTSFGYSNRSLSSAKWDGSGILTVSVDITNIGEVEGDEIVQLYIQDVVGEVVRPVKELKSFQKVSLSPGETKTVTFEISHDMLQYYHSDLTFASDPGQFRVYVNGSSVCEEENTLTFSLVKS